MNQKVYLGVRLLLGLIFLIFGTNGLMMVLSGSGFIPMPPPKPEVMEIMGGFFKIGYLMPLVKSLQIAAALMLLSGFFVNLALVFLGPIIVNILFVHIFIDTAGLPIAIVISILFGLMLKFRWNDFKALVKCK
jgi:putative oxidoreductase